MSMIRRGGRSAWLSGVVACLGAASGISCGGADRPAAPRNPPQVSLSVGTGGIRPGDAVTVAATALPASSADGIRLLRLQVSGATTFVDSTTSNGTGPVSLTDVVTMPLTTGEVRVVATAISASGDTGSREVRIALTDSVPPVLSVTLAPSAGLPLEPGDTLGVTVDASDAVGLAYLVARLSGSFSAVDSFVPAPGTLAMQRVSRFVVPPSAGLGDTAHLTIAAGNIGAIRSIARVETLTVRDLRPPQIRGVVGGARPNGAFEVGDTLRVTVSATDNVRTSRLGYVVGAPGNARDSVTVSGTSGQHTFSAPIPQSWTGTSTVSVFATDSIGNRGALAVAVVTVDSGTRTRQPIDSVSVNYAVGLTYDPVRRRLYSVLPAAHEVIVVNVDPATGPPAMLAPISVPGVPIDVDLLPNGDSLVVALSPGALAFVNVTTSAVDTVHVVPEVNGYVERVRAVDGGRVVFVVGGVGSGDIKGSVRQFDLATGSVSTVPAERLDTPGSELPIAVSGNRARLYGVVDSLCCPETGFAYDAVTRRFASRATYNGYYPNVSTDFTGERVLIGYQVFDRNLSLLESVPTTTGIASGNPSVLSPDGAFVFYGTGTRVNKFRLADSTEVDSLPARAEMGRMIIAPDGLTLFGLSRSAIYVLDVW